MKSNIEMLVIQFELHTRLFRNAVDGVEEKRKKLISEHTNHAAWIAGHLVSTRYMLVNLLGGSAQEPFAEFFANGKGIDFTREYPALDEQLTAWNSQAEELISRLRALTGDQLAQNAPFEVPTGKSLGQVLAFFAHHEAYHIGQLGYLKKFFTESAMDYK